MRKLRRYDDMDGITTQSCSCHHISEQPKKHLLSDARTGDRVRLRNGEIHELTIRKNNTNLGHDYWAGDNLQRSHDIDGCYLLSKQDHPLDIVELILKPELKVGDWVEIESSHVKGKTFVSVIKEIPNQEHYTVRVNSSFGGYTVYGVMGRQIIRKLKPSEIIVRIGCLSGTVRPVSTNGIHIWFHLIGVDDKTIATIRISSLDAYTRELVELLLKAQEEEK